MTMENPEPRPLPPVGPHLASPFDRNQRLIDAWNANVDTQREVLVHLKRAHGSNLVTRYVSIGVLMVIVMLVYVVGLASRSTILATETAQQERREADKQTAEVLHEQDRKLGLVLDSMTRLLEAKLAEDASRRAPKDVDLKAEVTRSRAEALATTLEAKQAVAPAPAAKAAATRLDNLKVQAREKGVDITGNSTATPVPEL